MWRIGPPRLMLVRSPTPLGCGVVPDAHKAREEATRGGGLFYINRCRFYMSRVGLEPTTIGLKVQCSTN